MCWVAAQATSPFMGYTHSGAKAIGVLRPGFLTVNVIAVLIALASLESGSANATADQTLGPTTHRLGILVGGGIASYREDLIVPLGFDGAAFSVGGLYTRQAERTCARIRLRVSIGILQNRYSHEAYAAAVELRPSWVKMVSGTTDSNQVWCGIALPVQMTNLFMESWDDTHLYWLTTHSLAVTAEYRTRLPRLGCSIIRLDLPIVGLVSRPPAYRHQTQEALTHFTYHLSAPNRSFALKSVWGYQSPLLQLVIRRDSKGALMNLGLELELNHCPEPKPIWGLNTRLLFSYQWRIG